MQLDDRLDTVLRHSPLGDASLRTVFRQLADLLGTLPPDASSERVDAAFARLDAVSAKLPAAERAAILAEPWLRLRSERLVAVLTGAEPPVALAAIRAAQLDDTAWLSLVPRMPVHARGYLRHRRDLGAPVVALLERLGIGDRALPPVVEETSSSAALPVEPASAVESPPDEGIAGLVRRIEAFRRARQASEKANGDAPRLPLGEEFQRAAERLRAFDFTTDSEGRVVWADPGATPLVVGLLLGGEAATGAGTRTAIERRRPLRAVTLEVDGAPALAGSWRVDAAPGFDPLSGRFLGYRGRFRRSPPVSEVVPEESGGDRVRQILHELRTPVNAIQGFAEVIQQQLFGPTPHEYRALAAAIAGDAARMLAGFEELDRLAKLESGALDLDQGVCDFAEVVRSTVAQLERSGPAGASAFDVRTDGSAMPLALTRGEAERMTWRILAALAGAAAPGERLRVRLRTRDDHGYRLSADLPSRLSALPGDSLFHAAAADTASAVSAGMFGLGFTLRLAAAEAKAAGGDIRRRDSRLQLTLPGLTAAAPVHSQNADEGHSQRAAS